MSVIAKLVGTAAVIGVSLALGGCNTTLTENNAKACDGYSRRPLNRSLWDWEGGSRTPVAVAVPPPASAPTAPIQRLGAARPAPSANGATVAQQAPLPPARPGPNRQLAFDIAGSRKPCA